MSARTYLAFTAFGLALLTGLLLGAGHWQLHRLQASSSQALQARALAVQALMEQEQRTSLQQRGDLVASNQAFVSYVGAALDAGSLPGTGVDVASLLDLLVERREQFGLDRMAVLDLSGTVLVGTDPALLRRRDLSREASVRSALDSLQPASGLLMDDAGLHLVAVKPLLRGGVAQGFLLVGQRLDDRFARRLAEAAGMKVALVSINGGGRQLLAASFDAGRDAFLLATDDANAAVQAMAHPLFDESTASARIAYLMPERAAGLATAVWPPLVAVLALLLVGFVLLAIRIWYGLLGPLGSVPSMLSAAASGDVHLRLHPAGTVQMRAIAHAFNRLMASLKQEQAGRANSPTQSSEATQA